MKRIIWDRKRLPCWWIPIEGSRPHLLKWMSFFISFWCFAKKSHFERAGNRRAFSEFQWDEVSVRALALSDDGWGAGLSGNVAKTIAEMAEIYRSEPEKFENILNRIGWEVWKQKEESTLYVNSHRLSRFWRFKRFTGFPSFVNTIYSKLRGASIF